MTGVLRIREFRDLWIGQTVSQFGDAVYGMLFIYMADKTTRDPAVVGLVAALAALPFLIVGPFAGVVADRVDRRKVMLAADLCSAAVLAGFMAVLATWPVPPVAAILVTPFLLSVVNAFFMPARGAALPRLVPEGRLLEANSLSSSTMHLMNNAGLILAGIVLAPLEAADPDRFFLLAVSVNLLTFLVSAAFIGRLPALEPRRGDDEGKWTEDLRAGARAVWSRAALRAMMGANLVVSLAIAGFMVVYTSTNRAWFGGDFRSLTVIELTFTVPLVIASLLVGKFRVQRVGIAFAVCLGAVGLCVAGMGFARDLWVYCTLNAVCGIVLPFASIPAMTYMSLAVPDALRGRVQSVATMVTAGVQPLGAGLTGLGLKNLGLTGMYLVMGIGTTLPGLTALAASPAFRQARVPSGSGGVEGQVPTDPGEG
ncbi:MAG: MFS transporter [Armatimonadetes bacterium]|nr:MFS transporter [Armatimonadota bacterium]